MALTIPPGSLKLQFRASRFVRSTLIIAIAVSAVWLLPSQLRSHLQPQAHAATSFTVINTSDLGVGSLRQAILDANANPGQDIIAFNIPGTGVQTITPNSALPAVTESVVIDGYIQPGSSPNSLMDGNNAVLLVELNGINIVGSSSAPGLQINTSNCEAKGLVINRFPGNGISISGSAGNPTSNNIIQGNFIGTDSAGAIAQGNDDGVEIQFSTNNLIGGPTASARNIISGNRSRGILVSTGASTNVIQGNFIGTNASGTTAVGNNGGGIWSAGTGPDNIGGTLAGARNVISGNLNNAGIFIQSGTSTGPVIQGNLIGTDVTGTVALGNHFGIWLNFGTQGNGTIGGAVAGARNVISGNRSDGVFISGNSRNNQLHGNFIGTDISGTQPLGNVANGVRIDAFAVSNRIGGAFPGEGNTIAFNARNGVLVEASSNATGNSIRRNSIFSNGALGIDLGGDGVTPNDPGDSDPGPNNRQNFPVITSVTTNGTLTAITGTLNSTPSTTFSVHFYSSSACDSSGSGEGTTPFGGGALAVTTDANGNGSFSVTIAGALPAGHVITATATDPNSNTSEFSVCGQSSLLTIFVEENTNDAAAVNSVTFVRGPFTLTDNFNFSSDHRTRVIFFTSNLNLMSSGPPDQSVLTVRAAGTLLTVENVGPISFPGLAASYIVVRLPDGLSPGPLSLTITFRGVPSSNSPTLNISP
jgi:hypothetical protein